MIGNDNLQEITVNFEIAIHNALKITWPSVDIVGCRFHLTQSWFCKSQNLGLASAYRSHNDNSDDQMAASQWLRSIFGLPFLSHEEVGDSFVEDFMNDIPTGVKFSKFADYLVENYIEEDARFPPKMWASFERNSVTSNPCEEFHAHFQKSFYHPHPDINTFTKRLVDNQTFVYVKLNSISEPPRPPSSKYRKAKAKLEDAKRMFLLGSLSGKIS